MAQQYPNAYNQTGLPPPNQMLGPAQIAMQTPQATLYIGNLDKTVTENLIFDRFTRYGKIIRFSIMRDKIKQESRGFAFIEFANIKDAEAAKSQLNNEKLATRYIRVMWKGDHKKVSNEANVHVKKIDPKVTQNDLEAYFQQFGPILSTFLSVDEKGDSNGYGYIQFRQETDAQRCLEEAKTRKLTVGESAVVVEPFKSKQERDLKRQENMRNLYMKDLPEKIDEAEIKKVLEKFGTVRNMIVGHPSEQHSSYALVAFSSKAEAEKALNELEKKPNVFKDQTKPLFICWHKSKQQLREERTKNREQDRDKTIYMRNLKPEIKKSDLEAVLKNLGTTHGWMALRPFEATENPTSSVRYKCQSAFIKMESADYVQTVLGHKEDKEVKALFISEKPFIDIAMPKADRDRMKQIQNRGRVPQFGSFPPQYLRFPPMPPFFQQQAQFPPMPFALNNTGYRSGNYMPRGGPRGRGGAPRAGGVPPQMRPQQQRPPMGGMPNMPYGGHPQQMKPQSMPQSKPATEPQKKLDLEMIKKNIANFKGMKPEEKRNILGELLYPKVSKEIGHHQAPKITGMLVDFDVMTEEEILEAIEDEAVLRQRITEAKEALDEAEQ